MKRKVKLPFDPKVFLSKVNGGRAIHDYRKDKIVFRQGDPADPGLWSQVQQGYANRSCTSLPSSLRIA